MWHPNKLQECTCTKGNTTCKVTNDSCWDHLGRAHAYLDVWLLEDRQTVCQCRLLGNTRCKKHPTAVCLDDNKIVRTSGIIWSISNCTKCVCEEGRIRCTQHHIEAFYGRFVVEKLKTCYPGDEPGCVTTNERSRDCYGTLIEW